MQPRETFNTVYFPTLEQRKNCYKQKNKCPHSFSNAVRTLAMVPVVGLSAQIVLCLHSVLRARTAFAPRPGKTLHRTVLFPPASSPVRLNQTQRHPTGTSVFGAGGGTRTHTVLLPTDFESVTSANSITPANMCKFCTYISLTHFLNGFKRENHIILKI